MDIFGVYIEENYIYILLVFHIIASFFIALFVSMFIRQRYEVQTEAARKNDKMRLERIGERSLLFKILFQISLHKHNSFASFLFFFIYNISIPVFGYFASLWIAYYLVNTEYEHNVVNTSILNLDEFELSFLSVERIFGEGSMSNMILAEDIPKSKKLKALSSLSSNISPLTLRIIKQTLSSKNDEIRMYGYAIINKIEQRLNENINKHLEIYNNEELDTSLRYESAKELAFFYWEMVYTELSHETLRDSFIKEVTKYLDIAKEYYDEMIEEHTLIALDYKHEVIKIRKQNMLKKEDIEKIKDIEKEIYANRDLAKSYRDTKAKLYILMGRVYMMQKDYDHALAEFNTAQELSESDFSFVLPYIAEIYYIMRDFDTAKKIMNDASSLDFNPRLYPIIAQWRSSNDRT